MKRKQLLLLLALLMTVATGAWAQQTLTVYDGTFEENYSPANICYSDEFTRSQTVIPSTALTAMKGCDITAMKFYSNNMAASGTIDYSFDVYLKEVSYTAFTDPYTFEPKSSCTTVHQGKLSISNFELTITFSKPFHYKGGNLLLGMENNSIVTYYEIRFLGTNTGSSLSNISIHHRTDLASATSITTRYFIPKTTFTYVVPTYSVKLAEGTKDAANWTIASGEKSAKGDNADGLTGLNPKDAVTLTYSGRLKVKGVTATTDYDPLATPLTVEALTAGTIVVNITDEDDDPVRLETGMQYSVNGGTTKTPIYETTEIPVAKGDKVQFYGNGTDTQVYGNYPMVSILGSGDGFQTKVYGNIMSLLDETGFATNTDLPNAYVFYELFAGNTTLIDASELLLPAETLTTGCYEYMFERCTNLTMAPKLPAETLATQCYEGMFLRCTSLTTAPKLPATTLATKCYCEMFFKCTSLTNAYVKAAYTNTRGNFECRNMFKGCTATDAVLHTTLDNKASWEAVMGPDKEWENWTVADDWQD